MPASRSRLAYGDCETFLDEALADAEGARLEFPNYGQAHYFMMRCHTFRAIARDDNKEIHKEDRNHPLYGRSDYDVLRLSVKKGVDGEAQHWVYAIKNQLDPGDVERLTPEEEEPATEGGEG